MLITLWSGLLAEIRWSVYISKSHSCLCVLFSRSGVGLCTYHLLMRSNLNILHLSQWITLLTQSCLVLYFFCANLLHSLIMWLIVSSLSLHSLHLLFCWVLSILALIWLVLMALSWDSVSLLRFPFLSPVQVFSSEMVFISRLLLLLLQLFTSFRAFLTSVRKLFLTWIWVKANLYKSPLLKYSGRFQ